MRQTYDLVGHVGLCVEQGMQFLYRPHCTAILKSLKKLCQSNIMFHPRFGHCFDSVHGAKCLKIENSFCLLTVKCLPCKTASKMFAVTGSQATCNLSFCISRKYIGKQHRGSETCAFKHVQYYYSTFHYMHLQPMNIASAVIGYF